MPRRRSGRAVDVEAVKASLQEIHHPVHADRPPAIFLAALVRKFKNLGTALGRLAVTDPAERVHNDACTLLFVAAQDPSVPRSLSERLLADAAPVLLEGLKDPKVSDERKYTLGPLLELTGEGLDGDEYRACFQDFDSIAEKRNREQMSQIPASLEGIDLSLESFGLIDHGHDPEPPGAERLEPAFQVAQAIVEHNPPVGTALLCVAAAVAGEIDVMADESTEALESAARRGSPEKAAWLLRELSNWPALGLLGARARDLFEELTNKGVTPRALPTGDFSHGVVSCLDGVGSRTIVLFFKSGDGGLHAFSLLLNDEAGVKDAWCAFGEGAEVEEGLREGAIQIAPCDVAFARELFADALVVHERNDQPLPGRLLLYRPFLGEAPIVASARRPDLGVYLLETVVPGPELVDGSESLVAHPLYGEFWCSSDAAYDALTALGLARGRVTKQQKERALVEIERLALKDRDVLARRLATNLELEARAGRANRPITRLAARTWLAMTQDVVPFEKIPYVRALCRRAVDAITANLRQGFKNQNEANQADLHDEEPSPAARR